MTDLAELKQRQSKIAEFIASSDNEDRICLLPYADFLEKYSAQTNEEQILLLYEFKKLSETGRISAEYLKLEWNKINFEKFVNSEIETINNIDFLENRLMFTVKIKKELTSIIRSNEPIEQKIISLSELVRNYIQYYGTENSADDVLFNDIKSELNYLKELQTQRFLIDKFNDIKPPSVTHTSVSQISNDFPEIFAETGFQTFKMLDEKYQKDNKKLFAKYSNLFWFLYKEDLLKCTQLEYISFIQHEYSIKLSKIQPKTAKYEDIIQPLLMRYFKNQL